LINKELVVKIDNKINDIIDNKENIHEILKQSMKYSINAGGKRLRPILFLEVFKALSDNNIDSVINYACAIEMIHTYSLIHDDLPAMDNDELRRNKPTNHIVYGEDIAILAGDGLLNCAMEILIDEIIDEKTKNASKAISKACGVSGMISGQVYDVVSIKDEKELDLLHQLKTGELIKCALLASGYLANATKEKIKLLEEYGNCIGIAFQISDDILDVEGNTKKLGKNIHSDEKNDRITYISFYGLLKSKDILKDNINKAVIIAKKLNIKFLEQLALYILERKS